MALKSSIERLVNEADWQPLLALIRSRGSTGPIVHAWLNDRGYTFSFKVVYGYMRHCRLRWAGELRLPADACAATVKTEVLKFMDRFDERQLWALAEYAAFLARGTEATAATKELIA